VRKALPPILAVLSIAVASGAGEVDVRTVDGARRRGTLTALTAKGATLAAGGETTTIALKDLAEIASPSPAPDPLTRAGQKIVRTGGGGLLAAEAVEVADGKVTVQTALTGKVTLAIEAVTEIILPGEATPTAVLAESSRSGGAADKAADRMFVRTRPKRVMAVPGALTGLSAEKISFDYEGKRRTIDTARVVRIVLAQAAPAAAPRGVLLGADGTRLPFASVTLREGRYALTGTPIGTLALDAKQMAAIRFRSDRLVYLSDLTPTRVSQAGTLGPGLPHRRDRCAKGTPLRLDGRTYARGLGLHSRCELTYTLGGQYIQLLARVGIDDAARPGGHAVLTITADGKTLLGPLTITGADPARTIRLDLADAHTLTILVDFGRDLDVGDHVDLADARLVK